MSRLETPRPPTHEKHVGIWVRVSTEEQAKGESPEHHEERARLYAEMKGWTVVTVYRLEAVSGKSVMGHPEAKRMLEDIRSGAVSALIFSKLARLARNTRELIEIADIFRDCEADLVSLQESIDTSTPGGRNLFRIMGSFAEWEREEIAERVAASVPIRAKLGKPLGGAAPFGYRWQDRTLVPDPDEAPVRRRMYELFAEHRRLLTVARLLTEAGHRTRSGAAFTHTTVERLIRDPIAKGRRRANYTKSLGEKKHWQLKPESEWVWTEVEAVVSEELWDECNRILDERRKAAKPPARRGVHLLSGVVVCGCGSKMYVTTASPNKYVCYRPGCRNKVPIADLDSSFEDQLRDFFLYPEAVEGYLSQADDALAAKEALLESLIRERERVEAEMEKTYRLYLADEISPKGFGSRYKPLEARSAQLADEIVRLQAETDFLSIERLSAETTMAEAEGLYERWGDLPFGERRRVVESIVEQITVTDEEIAVQLSTLLPPEIAAKGAHNPRDS